MNGIECPYCHEISMDTEFCDECGRNIAQKLNKADTETEKTETENIDKSGKWSRDVFSLDCDIILSSNEIMCTSSFLDEYSSIRYPFYCKKREDNKYELFFKHEEGVKDLKSWIAENIISTEKALVIIRKISLIVQRIQRNNRILGTFDLSDFWIKDGDLESIFFRVTREFYGSRDFTETDELGEYTALEIKNRVFDDLDNSSDVFLIGKLFVNIILSRTNYINYSEFRYLAHELSIFNEDMPIGIHKWIGKSTSIIKSERYKNVTDQLNDLNKILSLDKKRKSKSTSKVKYIQWSAKTHCGEGKKKLFPENTDESIVNEDRYIVLEDESRKKILAIVADGISNCKYGSGAYAAQYLVDSAQYLWDKSREELYSDEKVIDFFKNLVSEANRRIKEHIMNEYIIDDIDEIESSDIMGTTLTGVFINNNEVYSVSIGDSRTYIYSNKGLSLVHFDDNILNYTLKEKKLSWDEIYGCDDKYLITRNVGNISQDPEEIIKLRKFNLLDDEILILCSDGITDYINQIEYRNDEWNIDTKLAEIINSERNGMNSLDKISRILINEANKNGGGDNMSIIMIKVK